MENEKRLIDANVLLNLLRPLGQYSQILQKILRIIETCPTVDAVEVVRCKDCFYWTEHDGERFCSCWCGLHSDTAADDFCSYGERRDGECI